MGEISMRSQLGNVQLTGAFTAYSKYSCCAQVVEDGYEFFAKRQLVTLFSAPNYCGEFDNAGAMMSVDETLMCSFQVREWVGCGGRIGRAAGGLEQKGLFL